MNKGRAVIGRFYKTEKDAFKEAVKMSKVWNDEREVLVGSCSGGFVVFYGNQLK